MGYYLIVLSFLGVSLSNQNKSKLTSHQYFYCSMTQVISTDLNSTVHLSKQLTVILTEDKNKTKQKRTFRLVFGFTKTLFTC